MKRRSSSRKTPSQQNKPRGRRHAQFKRGSRRAKTRDRNEGRRSAMVWLAEADTAAARTRGLGTAPSGPSTTPTTPPAQASQAAQPAQPVVGAELEPVVETRDAAQVQAAEGAVERRAITRTDEIRKSFLDFFAASDHRVVESYPLVPANDPTLLFTNAGMVQFKDLFTGLEQRDYRRATSSQKCVRAGGKHNDLENVGRTARHHTFFEMLGNFSFGDYFKREAIRFAWDWVTKEIGLSPDRLHVTVFEGSDNVPPDDEAYEIWHRDIGLPESHISRGTKKDNFWQMGDTGPCGPCSELHFDRGEVKGTFGGDDPEGDRVLELWNLVFMQYEQLAGGELRPLPAPSVDTGAGLERLAMVLGDHRSNYDTDAFAALIERCAADAGKNYRSSDAEDDVSLRVLADHGRACSFLMADGVLPSNEGRGYVLRRIIRRAVRHGERLGLGDLFFHRVCDQVVGMMGEVYPGLIEARALIEKLATQEEEAFRRTLDRGLKRFALAADSLTEGASLDGAVVHKLYEQDGFPIDLTEVLCRERALDIDWTRFEQAKQAHVEASRGALGLDGIPEIYKSLRSARGATPFLGYETTEAEAEVLDLIQDDKLVDEAAAGARVALVATRTPFYGESGGQIGDIGEAVSEQAHVEIEDTKKYNDLIVHLGRVTRGQVRPGETLSFRVDRARRDLIRANHTATHLMHKGLRDVLGDHVKQAGSMVAPDRLRFDYSHFQAMSDDEIERVEAFVNAEVTRNTAVETQLVPIDEARAAGAVALFGEKYADEVRMVRAGPHTLELCGGTHVRQTGDIGFFKITSEGPLAAGVRRIEATTRDGALAHVQARERELRDMARRLKVGVAELPGQVDKLATRVKELEHSLSAEKQRQATHDAHDLVRQVQEVKGVRVLATRVEGVDAKDLRGYADKLRDQLGTGVVVLGAENKGKANLLVAVTKDLTDRVHAGELVKQLAQTVGGSGGGRPDFAQAGGNQPERLDEALARVAELLPEPLNGSVNL